MQTLQKMKSAIKPVGGALALAGMQAAHAAVDVTEVVAEIEGAAPAVALIGAAVLVLIVGIMAFKWVRRALS